MSNFLSALWSMFISGMGHIPFADDGKIDEPTNTCGGFGKGPLVTDLFNYQLTKKGSCVMFKHRVFHLGGERSHTRLKCRIPVDYVVNKRAYRDFIENISQKGAYIGTKQSLVVGSDIVMTFMWKGLSGPPVKSSGKVIRSNKNGFAVLFEEPITIQ